MTTTLLIAQFIIAVILTIAVLLQKSSSIGLGAYSGSNESLFGAKGPAGFLAKFTFFMAFVFVLNTLALGYMYNSASKDSLADQIVSETKKEKKIIPSSAEAPKAVDAPSAPSAPSVPSVPSKTNTTK